MIQNDDLLKVISDPRIAGVVVESVTRCCEIDPLRDQQASRVAAARLTLVVT